MSVVVDMRELARLRRKFTAVENILTKSGELADAIGQQQEDSARHRIRETKTDPYGKRWAPWSKRRATQSRNRSGRYKKRKGGGSHGSQSLLVKTGALADSLDHNVINSLTVEVGSPLVYAGVHLYGYPERNIPQRAYLDTQPGFADPKDRREIRDIIREIWNRELKRR